MKHLLLFLIFISFSFYSISKETLTDVEFASDQLEIKENENIIIATGNVIIKSKFRKISADKVMYNKLTDKAVATGNVILEEIDGSIYESDKIFLTEEFKSISSIALYGTFPDQSKISAKNFIKDSKGNGFIKKGVYTACNCNLKKNELPIWELNSSRIRHDPQSKTVYHNHVVMKLLSLPFAYIPYLNHPDWTVRRRSGLLTPSIGYKKRTRFETKIPYYIVSEDETWDMTITTHQKGKSGHADQINFRKKFDKTNVETNLFKGNLDTNKKDGDDVFYGDLEFKSKLDYDWQLSSEIKYSDQDTFMRRYGFDDDNRYKTFIKAEKLKKNKISELEIYNIESLDSGVDSYNEPFVAPSLSHHKFFKINQVDYDLRVQAFNIIDDEYYDIQRWSGMLQANHKYKMDEVNFNFDIEGGLDLYAIKSRPTSDTSSQKYIDRFSVGTGFTISKNYLYHLNNNGIFLEPKIKFSSMNSNDRTDDVPNRDSSDYRLDESNLFLTNKYQGRDNIQNNQRVSYGINTIFFQDSLGEVDLFLGQSQKIGGTEKNTIISDPSRQSDIVNNINWRPNNSDVFSWNSLLDPHKLEPNYSNFSIKGQINSDNSKDNWEYSINHIALDGLLVNGNVSREELEYSLVKNLNNWKYGYSKKLDLSDNEEEVLEEKFVIEYTGEYMLQNCFSIKMEYKNTGGQEDRDLVPDDSIFLTFTFRNLGDYSYNPKFVYKYLNQEN